MPTPAWQAVVRPLRHRLALPISRRGARYVAAGEAALRGLTRDAWECGVPEQHYHDTFTWKHAEMAVRVGELLMEVGEAVAGRDGRPSREARTGRPSEEQEG